MSFETKSTLDIFKSYCSTLAENLREKTPNLSQQIYFCSSIQYYSHFIQTDAFHLTCTTEIDIEKILRAQAFINRYKLTLGSFSEKWFTSFIKTF